MKGMYYLHWRKTPAERKVSPLHSAAFFGTRREVEPLLSKSADLNIQDIAGKTPLHYAAMSRNLETMRTLLNAGADPNAQDKDGATPLHNLIGYLSDEPSSLQAIGLIRSFIAKGANVNALTHKGMAPLHYACALKTKAQPSLVRTLMKFGANPFVDNNDLCSPLSLANDKIETVRVLLGIENHPAFRACKNLHDCCEILWPASREKLPPEWEKWAKRSGADKPTPEIDALWDFFQSCDMKSQLKAMEKVKKRIEDYGSYSISIEEIRDCLIECHPLFAKAWELANQKEKLIVEEIDEPIGPKGEAWAPAAYRSDLHKIQILRSLPGETKLFVLIFETMNALQRERVNERKESLLGGNLGREENALLIELIESRTLRWTLYILSSKAPPPELEECWMLAQKKIEASKDIPIDLTSHADGYRKLWDVGLLPRYVSKHPKKFRARLEELRKTAS